jgi:hypothetical protein
LLQAHSKTLTQNTRRKSREVREEIQSQALPETLVETQLALSRRGSRHREDSWEEVAAQATSFSLGLGEGLTTICGIPGVFQPESKKAQLEVLGAANTDALTVPPFAGTVQLSGVAQLPACFICTSTLDGLYHWKLTLGPSVLPAGVICPF